MSANKLAKESEILPKGWTWLAMSDVGHWVGGGTPSKANPRFWTNGNIPWVSPKDMKFDLITDAQDHITEDAVAQSATNLIEAGSVLIVVRSGILQHTLPVAVTQRRVALNQDLKAINPRENVRTDYLALALKAFEQEVLHTCTKTGTTVQSLEMPIFLRFQIPVAPIREQRRIVTEIEKQFTRLEAGIDALLRAQTNCKRYRSAVLKAACAGQLVPLEADFQKSACKPQIEFESGEQLLKRILIERRQRWTGGSQYKEPVATNKANLPPLPIGWTWATLDALAAIKGGITKDKNRKHNSPVRSVPYLRVANVQRGYLDLKEMKEIVATEDEIQELALKPGDILLNEGGDRDKLGRGWVWSAELPECIHQNHVFRARTYASGLNSKFISWYANSFGQKYFFDEGKHTTNLASISMTKLKELPVPIPPPVEQERIVAEVERRLSVVDELESVLSTSLQRATHLRRSILQKAFTGNLVPQDPSDEPADVLFKRIESISEKVQPPKKMATPKDRANMISVPVSTLKELLLRLDSIGGAAAPDRLLSAAGLSDEIETFFDLLREGRNNGTLIVPMGAGGEITRSNNEN